MVDRSAAQLATYGGPEDLTRPVEEQLVVKPAGPPRTRLELHVGGEMVSKLSVLDLRQQIGGAVVRTAGIAGVFTPEQHRMKGYARRLMWNALRWMRREGYDFSMLYGIRGFYPRFGYVTAFPNILFTLAVRDAERAVGRREGLRVVDYRPSHLRRILRLYHATNAGRTGPIRRDPESWIPWRKGVGYRSKARCKVILDASGRIIGYLVYSDDHPAATIIEIGYKSSAVFPCLLGVAFRIFWSRRLGEVRFSLPEDEPFLEFCRPLGLKKEITYRRDGSAMIRMVNVASALEKVAPVLAGRMSKPGRLNLHTNLEQVGLSWSRGRMRVSHVQKNSPQARLPQWALARMLFGYCNASALAVAGSIRATGSVITVLDEMFPEIPHFHYAVDEF